MFLFKIVKKKKNSDGFLMRFLLIKHTHVLLQNMVLYSVFIVLI